MRLRPEYRDACLEWIQERFDALPEALDFYKPSEFAELYRRLPVGKSRVPGAYSFEHTPYLREIIDCLDPRDPTQIVSLMKGAQTGGTVGIIENAYIYDIGYLKTCATAFITETQDLATLRATEYIIPTVMLSDFATNLQSADEDNARKTGKTDKKLNWRGGGSSVFIGAKSVSKMVSLSLERLYRDEISKWPLTVGKSGSPLKLTEDRTLAFELSRKIVDISTPGTKGLCHIEAQHDRGDQRKYYVPCVNCGGMQVLRWQGVDTETGLVYGMDWDTKPDGLPVEGSARYVCRFCGHRHRNADKVKLLPDAAMGGRAEWRPTATPKNSLHKSYHLPGLYAAPFMYSWDTAVNDWIEAWDPVERRPRDIEKLKRFYNSILGEPFQEMGGKIKIQTVSKHRRSYYNFGEIPNKACADYCGGPAAFCVCTVDVHGNNLAVATWAVYEGKRLHLLEYMRLKGNTARIEDPGTWGELQNLLLHKTYVADDGRIYRPALTLIDASFKPTEGAAGANRENVVLQFCDKFDGVYPLMGRNYSVKAGAFKEFSETKTATGGPGFYVNVDIYKNAWSDALQVTWSGQGLQPERFFSAPQDTTSEQLKELTKEYKAEIKGTDGVVRGYEWKRPGGAANELWDLLIYADAAVDIMAVDVARTVFDAKDVNWPDFWQYCADERPFYVL